MIFLLTIVVIGYGAAAWLVGRQLLLLRRGEVRLSPTAPVLSFADYLSLTLDKMAGYVSHFSREAAHLFSILSLIGAKRVAAGVKHNTGRVERILSQVLHATHERRKRGRGERGSTSMFLREIELHQSKVKDSLNSYRGN